MMNKRGIGEEVGIRGAVGVGMSRALVVRLLCREKQSGGGK